MSTKLRFYLNIYALFFAFSMYACCFKDDTKNTEKSDNKKLFIKSICLEISRLYPWIIQNKIFKLDFFGTKTTLFHEIGHFMFCPFGSVRKISAKKDTNQGARGYITYISCMYKDPRYEFVRCAAGSAFAHIYGYSLNDALSGSNSDEEEFKKLLLSYSFKKFDIEKLLSFCAINIVSIIRDYDTTIKALVKLLIDANNILELDEIKAIYENYKKLPFPESLPF